MNKRIFIKGIPFDKVTRKEVVKQISEFLKSEKKYFITTPNPEFIVEASKNPKFKKVLQKADLSIADGIGILWAATFLQKKNQIILQKNKRATTPIKKTPNFQLSVFSSLFLGFTTLLQALFLPKKIKKILPERVCGSDLFLDLCQQSEAKIFLLGAGEGVAEKTAKILKKQNPKIKITGIYAGNPHQKEDTKTVNLINKSQAELLFVAYGAPKQELWINRNLNKLKTIKVAMGIGGSFDFVAGVQKRAPLFFRKLGLEWLWRLIREPKRFKRIWNATAVFIKKIIWNS